MIGWNFPPNNYGQKDGLNDSGIETFKGVPYESLAREVIQNSLDAARSGAPVQVHFTLYHVPRDEFPDATAFIEILGACRQEKPDHEANLKFFNSAMSVMADDELPVLKIGDYNTTGLLGSAGNGGTNDWENLIKSSGSSDKGAGKMGSFGIGKNAPFACSRLRTVCYSTRDYLGNVAFQGVSKLMTHKNSQGEETRGTGFYGILPKNEPIVDFSNLNPLFGREEIGTDLFIWAFNDSRQWEAEIIKSVIENYFVAIHEDKLIVKVGNTMINSNRLPELLETYLVSDQDYLAPKFFKALTSPDKHPFIEEDFLGMGKAELFVLPERNFPKRVAMVRGTGMRVFNKDRFQTPLQFSGVFIIRGEGLNNFARGLEPPSHNAWEPQRHDDPAYAKGIVKKVYSWINDQVKTLAFIDDSEELDIEGISEFLPDDEDDFKPDASELSEGTDDGTPKEVEISIEAPKPSTLGVVLGDPVGDTGSDEGGQLEDGDNPNEGTGGIQPTTNGIGIGGNGGGAVKPKSPEGKMPTATSKPIALKKVRLFCSDPDQGTYRIVYEPLGTGQGYLKFTTVGDDGTREPAPVSRAVEPETGTSVEVDGNGRIGPLAFANGVQGVLQVTLMDGLRCAMEVFTTGHIFVRCRDAFFSFTRQIILNFWTFRPKYVSVYCQNCTYSLTGA